MVQQILFIGNLKKITNQNYRIPMIAICVGLAVNKELRAGIVYNPITDELFAAQAGKGATKNGFPIQVSKTKCNQF